MDNQRQREQAAERKRRQRERQRSFGRHVIEVVLSDREFEQMKQSCSLRAAGRDPYDMDEYISTLIRRDHERLTAQLAELGARPKCGDVLPDGCGGLFKGEEACWLTFEAKKLLL